MKKRRTLKTRGNQFDTIKYIKKVASIPDPLILELALRLKKKHPGNIVKQLQEGFNYAFEKTRFIKDPPTIQQIRSPRRMIKDGLANCVDYTTFFASLCKALDIPCTLKMVCFDNSENYSHIYTVTRTTPPIYLDAVIGQNQDGTEIMKPPGERTNFFNKQTPYKKAYELDI